MIRPWPTQRSSSTNFYCHNFRGIFRTPSRERCFGTQEFTRFLSTAIVTASIHALWRVLSNKVILVLESGKLSVRPQVCWAQVSTGICYSADGWSAASHKCRMTLLEAPMCGCLCVGVRLRVSVLRRGEGGGTQTSMRGEGGVGKEKKGQTRRKQFRS